MTDHSANDQFHATFMQGHDAAYLEQTQAHPADNAGGPDRIAAMGAAVKEAIERG